MNHERLANELLRRQWAKESLDDYGNYMSSSQHLDFIYPPAKHHRVITRAIDALLTPLDSPEHPKDQHGIPVTRLLLTAPPGSAKSTYCSVQLPTYVLAKYPDKSILCASNVGDLAKAFNRRRRSACMTQEWQNLAETTLDPDASSVDRFYTREGGSIMAAGAGKTIVGVRSWLNICDDPIESWEQAQSETQLSKLWDWYEGEYRNRQHGIPGALEILMHQRWSRNDIAGVILRMIKSREETGWMVINLPLVAEGAPEVPDPVARQPGEVLWPENPAFSQKNLQELQRDPAKWAALYQQKPLDEEGAWVGPEHISYIQPHEWMDLRKNHQYRYLAAGDLALSINKGDWTVLFIGAISPGRDLIICDVIRKQQAPEKSVEDLYRLNDIYHPTGWLLDDDNATKVWSRLVYETARNENRSPPPLDIMPMRGRDKEIRAAAIRGYFRAGRVQIVNDPRWAPDLVREILAFPGEPDDQIDCLGLLGRKMVQMTGIEDQKPKEAKPIQGLIIETEEGPRLSLGLDTLFEEHERGKKKWNHLRIG